MHPWIALALAVALPAVAQTNQPAPKKARSYEEADVPAYVLPDPFAFADGRKVATAADWPARRAETLRLFEEHVYGRMPLGRPDHLRFVLREEKKDARNGRATRLRVGILFEGRDDGRQMELLVYLPNAATNPAPAFLGLNFGGNHSITDDPDLPLPTHWVMGLSPGESADHKPSEASRGKQKELWCVDQVLDAGFATATACYGEIEPDQNGNWQKGPRGLAPEPGPGDWSAIGGWSWALSRALDYLETNPRIDAKRIVVHGFSRLGKTALWAGAQDTRFAAVISFESGAGGAALSRRIFGETTADLVTRFPHWFCANNARYADNEAACPVDQHQLLALIAPRPLLVTSRTEDRWSDPHGEFLSAQAAAPVYRLLTGEGLSVSEWTAPGQLANGRLAYVLHAGKHDVGPPEWTSAIAFARRNGL